MRARREARRVWGTQSERGIPAADGVAASRARRRLCALHPFVNKPEKVCARQFQRRATPWIRSAPQPRRAQDNVVEADVPGHSPDQPIRGDAASHRHGAGRQARHRRGHGPVGGHCRPTSSTSCTSWGCWPRSDSRLRAADARETFSRPPSRAPGSSASTSPRPTSTSRSSTRRCRFWPEPSTNCTRTPTRRTTSWTVSSADRRGDRAGPGGARQGSRDRRQHSRPGTPDGTTSVFAPNWNWNDVPLRDLLTERVPGCTDHPRQPAACEHRRRTVVRCRPRPRRRRRPHPGNRRRRGPGRPGGALPRGHEHGRRMGPHQPRHRRPRVPPRDASVAWRPTWAHPASCSTSRRPTRTARSCTPTTRRRPSTPWPPPTPPEDPAAQQVIATTGQYLGIAIANLINLSTRRSSCSPAGSPTGWKRRPPHVRAPPPATHSPNPGKHRDQSLPHRPQPGQPRRGDPRPRRIPVLTLLL